MNRDQRRQAYKARIQPEELKRYEIAREAEIIERIVHELNTATLMVLRDKFGFGTVRLKRLHDALLEIWDSVEKGYLSIKDMENTIFNETGLDVRSKTKQ